MVTHGWYMFAANAENSHRQQSHNWFRSECAAELALRDGDGGTNTEPGVSYLEGVQCILSSRGSQDRNLKAETG
jgi:hypothetical protein